VSVSSWHTGVSQATNPALLWCCRGPHAAHEVLPLDPRNSRFVLETRQEPLSGLPGGAARAHEAGGGAGRAGSGAASHDARAGGDEREWGLARAADKGGARVQRGERRKRRKLSARDADGKSIVYVRSNRPMDESEVSGPSTDKKLLLVPARQR